MGLAVGLAWIIFGVCYMVYKYCNEDLRMSPMKSLGMVALGFVGFFILGAIAGGMQWLQDDASILYSIIMLPIAIGGCVLVGWLVVGDVKDAIKDKTLQGEVVQDKPAQQGISMSALERRAKVKAFRRKWFLEHDELLTLNNAERKLKKYGDEIVVTQAMIEEEARAALQENSGTSIEWTEWLRLYGAENDTDSND